MAEHARIRVGIAGGGLLGRLCAWRLALSGHEVTVFDAAAFAQPAGACWTAAGMISPLSELVHSPREVYDLGLQSLALWPTWLEAQCLTAKSLKADRLETMVSREDSSGQSQNPASFFRHQGSLVVAHPQDQNELRQFYQDLDHKLADEAREGRPSLNDLVDTLTHRDIAQIEPALSHFEHALYLKPEGDLNNRALIDFLLVELKALGVTLVEYAKVRCEEGLVIDEQNQQHSFDLVIDTRGLGAKEQLEGLRGVRGEVLYVQCPEVSLSRPVRLMHPRYKLYVAPKPDHLFVIGATEIESSDMSPMSVQSSLELSSALYTINPAFAEARILEQSVHCRPAMMDNLPVVEGEFVAGQPSLIRANGLYRHGYLLGPAIVNQVLEKIDASLVTPVCT